MDRIRVLIADDHILFQEGLKLLLETHLVYDFEVVGFANTGKELIGVLKSVRPDIIFLDLNMPNMDGLSALQYIKDWNSALKVIALTMYDDAKIIKKALSAGVNGYVLKHYGIQEVINAVDAINKGERYIGKGITFRDNKVINGKPATFDDKFVRKYKLTKRELEILQLISQALSNKEIAKELFISDQTVSVHRKNIMRKLNVTNTAGLIKVAYMNSLIY